MMPLEIWIVISILAAFFAISLLSYFSATAILAAGMAFIAIGLFIGIPIGFYYHILLFQRKKLLSRNLKNWWVSPHRYHKDLPERDRKLLNGWFWIGAAFFNIAMIGCGLVFIGLMIVK